MQKLCSINDINEVHIWYYLSNSNNVNDVNVSDAVLKFAAR